ncbi:MAG: 4Fe-4S cluster-binding domain-containing protein [Clostridia bacterium]
MCELCPRRCKIDRASGDIGFCGADDYSIKISRAALHFWEEPCISGMRGSGTIFFSYCTLRCAYCQNMPISRGQAGADVDVSRLADIMLDLEAQGAHNINLVTPTHYSMQIIAAIEIARRHGMSLPIVYNTSGYELPSAIERLRGYVDIFLTDYKYANNTDAMRYSGVCDYTEHASASLGKMLAIAPLSFFSDGIMRSGVILRHLLLPGKLTEAKNILKHTFLQCQNNIYYSLMSQYTPVPGGPFAFNRTVTKREYRRLIAYADRLGIQNAYIQEGASASESFIPPFDLTGVLHREAPQ